MRLKQFKSGWRYYLESRPNSNFNLKNELIRFTKSGSQRDSKILILGEQGIGDQIIFSSLFAELNKNYYTNLTDMLKVLN